MLVIVQVSTSNLSIFLKGMSKWDSLLVQYLSQHEILFVGREFFNRSTERLRFYISKPSRRDGQVFLFFFVINKRFRIILVDWVLGVHT